MTNLEGQKRKLIEFSDGEAIVRFLHKGVQTAQSAEQLRQYFQQRAFSLSGREIFTAEISVSPDAGDEFEAETEFVVRPEAPLYPGLQFIHDESPGVLPKLIVDLNEFTNQNELDEIHLRLVRQAISGLQEIIEPPIGE